MTIQPESGATAIGLETVIRHLVKRTEGEMARALARKLAPASTQEKSLHRLALAAEMQSCLRFDDAIPIRPVSDLTTILNRARPADSALEPAEFRELARTARISRLTSTYFSTRTDHYPETAARFRELMNEQSLEDRIDAAIDEEAQVRDSASPELRHIRRDLLKTRRSLRAAMERSLQAANESGYAAEDRPTVRGGRMVLPVKASAKNRVSGFIHDVSATAQTVYIEPAECLELNNRIREEEAHEAREIARICRFLTDSVRPCLDAFNVSTRLLSELEVLLAVARLANDMDAVIPDFNRDGVIRIRDGRNPELVLLFRGQNREVVPLTLEFGEHFQTLIISGPNAGGKSVAMKSIGLMTLMLGMGIPVPVAEGSSFHLFNRLLVDLGDAQSVSDDLSTYTSRLEKMVRMVEEAGNDSLILIDEAGTGTDPDAGAAIAQAVLEVLGRKGARTIVTTHHAALKVYGHQSSNAANGSMSFDADTLKPTFYFQAGTPGSSYASEIASRVGVPDNIIDRARYLEGAGRARMESLIATLQKSQTLVEGELARLADAGRALDQERELARKRIEKLQEERDTIRRDALNEADRILAGANASVENAVRRIRESQAASNVSKDARRKLESDRKTVQAEKRRVETRQDARMDRLMDTSSRSPTRTTGKISPGDRVSIAGLEAIGTVVELYEGEAVVVIGNLRMRIDRDRIARISGPEKQRVTVRQSLSTLTATYGSTSGAAKVDLRGCRVDEAIPRVQRALDDAVAAGLHSIEVVHGKGTGALRLAIREYLDGRTDIRDYAEAPWDAGGPGVTIVMFD